VNAASRQLSKAGRELHLHEQPGRLLLVLVEKPGELRTREELPKKRWPNETFVEFDDGLNTATQKIRQVLGDEARNPRFVETVPRQGYRFIAPVQMILPETSTPEPAAVVSELAPMPVPEPRRLPDWRIAAVAAALLGLAAGSDLPPPPAPCYTRCLPRPRASSVFPKHLKKWIPS
jgi:DNA-binding winged helix-turn-helix (wHTH) protein